MPELPEVETVCRTMRRALQGKRLAEVEAADDSIVYKMSSPGAVREALLGRRIERIGRKGKTWWIETESSPIVFGHLGMAGWVRELGAPTIRLREHGEAPLDDENGRPRFLKLMLTAEDGARIALTDGRRLARVWTAPSVAEDLKAQKLGPDAYDELPQGPGFKALFEARKAPIKAVLMDQNAISGIGNWIADEVLYQAGIAPHRMANSLTPSELKKLRQSIEAVIRFAVEVGADAEKYPEDWLFHYRWGGAKGATKLGGKAIVRETVGGRTTAWIPSLQK